MMHFKKGKSHQEAEQAVTDASQHLEEAKERNDEVQQVAGALREVRQRNHFAEQISVLMGKRA